MEHKIYPNDSIGKNAVIEEYVIIGVPPRGKKPGCARARGAVDRGLRRGRATAFIVP